MKVSKNKIFEAPAPKLEEYRKKIAHSSVFRHRIYRKIEEVEAQKGRFQEGARSPRQILCDGNNDYARR